MAEERVACSHRLGFGVHGIMPFGSALLAIRNIERTKFHCNRHRCFVGVALEVYITPRAHNT